LNAQAQHEQQMKMVEGRASALARPLAKEISLKVLV
jgi:hypothetical protein